MSINLYSVPIYSQIPSLHTCILSVGWETKFSRPIQSSLVNIRKWEIEEFRTEWCLLPPPPPSEFTLPLNLKFESFGTRRCVTGCVAPDVSKDLGALTFRVKQSKNCFVLRLLEHEEDYTTILRKVGSCTRSITFIYLRRLPSSAAPLW